MAEVLGIVSAASQLAALCCSLLRILQGIKSASLTLQICQVQLQDLSLLSSSISHNPLLQTNEIETLTHSLLYLIRKADLTSVLKKHRIVRALYIFYKEREILDALAAVERHKLSLCLSIEQVQSTALYEIRNQIFKMNFEKSNKGKKRSAVKTMNQQSVPVSPDKHVHASETRIERSSSAGKEPASCINGHRSNSNGSNPPLNASADADEARPNASGRPPHIQHICSQGAVKQKIGFFFEGSAFNLCRIRNTMKIAHIYQNGSGGQEVGAAATYHGQFHEEFDPANIAGSVRDIEMRGRAASESQTLPGQNIGVVIRDKTVDDEKEDKSQQRRK